MDYIFVITQSTTKANITMASNRNGNVVYELSGRALAAAKQLEQEIRTELETVSVMRSGNVRDMEDSWNAMYQGLLARLATEAPDVLKYTGLTSPCVRVFEGVQTFPRAYQEYPHIFTSPEQNPRYFMYAPLDYKGDHFVPADSKRLSGKAEEKTGDLLFAGGWLGNAPIVNVKREGVATPADYVAPSKSDLRKEFSYQSNDRVTFLAAGQSLALVEDYRARTEDWKQKLKTACDAITAETEKLKPVILAVLPAGEDVRISTSYNYAMNGGGKATLLLSARREGKVGLLSAGKTVNIPDSPAYTLGERNGGDYEVIPRRDTPEGRKLAALIDAIPQTPSLGDYPELCANYKVNQTSVEKALGVNGVIPQAVDVEGYTVLLYNTASKDKKNIFCPPGAKPFPVEVYEWLQSDKGDRNMGVALPPRPIEVTATLGVAQKFQPAKRSPKP